MNPTRRALCGLGVASVPLAMFGPRVFSAEQASTEAADAFLAYLAEDTKRNCRLAARPGRERAQAFRRLGANLEVAVAYAHSRDAIRDVKRRVSARVQAESLDAVALRVREGWRAFAAELGRDGGITVPPELDHDVVTAGIARAQRYGCPRATGVRAWLEREADRLDRLEGRAAAAIPVQTPGNDYGPEGWSAGIGDPPPMSCYDLGVLIAVIWAVIEVCPDFGAPLRIPAAILGVVYAVSCIT